ncbi:MULTISPECIES: phage late control D family protein [unclassified Pseudomonas]|uniref:phage late control D family protein n=1 Tax=unclassified Pseudomonas TaxID=196821 RepID=UPI0024478E87|nr:MULTISPECIES: phage late control D family protein [unclassified Pseudomonas]MDH0894679.1 phage late control D family protein [Pseudomonas sp. GD03875]MDH1067271.1 phage late control D family protein [Pseudomonas sp. GD03985]
MTGQLGALLGDAQQLYRDATAYPRPICRVVVDGRDITAAIEPRLVSIELTDNRGMEADQLDITLSDHDGLLAIPPRGATVQLWLGWDDTGLVDKGTYTVDETEHSGAPDVLSIRGRSADLRGGLKVKRERSWSTTTLGTIIGAVAAAHGLAPLVSAVLAGVELLHLDQANESDANLLARLGREYDAIATVKAGRLLFMPTGRSTTASGLALPHVTLTRADGDQHRFLEADRDAYTGVRAYYYEVNSAAKKEAIAGGGENLKELRHSYTDLASALQAARAEWNRLQRGTATLGYTLARARPELIPDQTYSLVGIKAEIAAIVWLGGNLRHSFTPEAFTTTLELESQLPDGDDVAELADDSGDYTGVVAWYRDEKTGQQHKVTAGDQANPRRLPHLYQSKSSAKRAADREWGRMRKNSNLL